MKNILIAALIALSFVGCKNKEENAATETAAPAASGNEFFQVTLDVIAKKDDHFHVFYTEDGSVNFTEENSIWTDVKGSETSQKVVFNLPKDVIPTQLRVDFGWAKDQGEIKLNTFEMSYYGKNFKIPGTDFWKYFMPNESNTIVDIPNGTMKSATNDGKVGPSAYPREELGKEVEKITK